MRTTKNKQKALRSMDKFIDIEQIYNNGIKLKDGTYIMGIKIIPFDIWTCNDVHARQILESLRYAYNVINFPIYHSFVYIPSSFESLENSLLKELEENATEQQTEIILDDLNKIDSFSKANKKLEFHLFIANKNQKILQKQYETMISEFSRSFIVHNLYYLDYINYCNWLFDLNDNLLPQAYYHGESLSEMPSKISENKSIYDEKEEMDLKTNKVIYSMYEVTDFLEYFMMNGRYYSIILVKELPPQYDVGLFNYLGRNQNIKMLYISQNSNLDLITHVRNEYKLLEESLKTAVAQKNMVQADELTNKIQSLKAYSEEMAINRDKTLDISLAFVVSHTDYKEMMYIKKNFMQSLRHQGFTVISPKYLQLALFKYFSPIFINDPILNSTQKNNIGFPLGTNSFALAYPYHFSTNEDQNGFLYGYEKNMNGRIIFNPYYYKDQESLAVQENRLNGNIILMGETGSGKSTDLFLLIRYFIRRNNFIMWIDPENQNKKYTLKMGGTYLEFGSNKFMFNLWQLCRVTSDEEDPDKLDAELWNTEQAIINAIDTFKKVLILYCREIKDSTLSVVGMIAERMYANKGITPKKTPSFEHLKNTDYPIMQDFALALRDIRNEFKEMNNTKFVDACEDLLIKITPMLQEHRFLFNGHTTQNIEIKKGQIIGIGTKNLYLKDKNVQSALYYIIYTQAFNYCLDNKIDSAFIYDEAHTTMKDDQTIDLLDQFTRRSRKYRNLTVLGTQEPLDLNKPNMLGILNNSTYIITKMLTKDNALRTLKEMIGVDDEDLYLIKGFQQGDSYFKCGKKAFYMHTLLTEKENMDKGNNYS